MLPSLGNIMIPVKINCAQDMNRLLLLRSLHNEKRKCFHLCYGHVKREKRPTSCCVEGWCELYCLLLIRSTRTVQRHPIGVILHGIERRLC